jgi:hypothetical protein
MGCATVEAKPSGDLGSCYADAALRDGLKHVQSLHEGQYRLSGVVLFVAAVSKLLVHQVEKPSEERYAMVRRANGNGTLGSQGNMSCSTMA